MWISLAPLSIPIVYLFRNNPANSDFGNYTRVPRVCEHPASGKHWTQRREFGSTRKKRREIKKKKVKSRMIRCVGIGTHCASRCFWKMKFISDILGCDVSIYFYRERVFRAVFFPCPSLVLSRALFTKLSAFRALFARCENAIGILIRAQTSKLYGWRRMECI